MNTNKAAAWGKPALPRYKMQFKVASLNAALGTFSGLAAAFGNLDKTNDIIEIGAFQKTLQAAYATKSRTNSAILWPLCWMHDNAKPVGAITSARETRDGLLIEGQCDLDVEAGRTAFSGLQKGYASAMSIGYDAVRATRDSKGVRHLLEVKLWEISLVTSGFAANDRASVDAASVKANSNSSKTTRAVDQQMARLEAQARGLGQGMDWRSQRLPLQGNPAPARYVDPGPPPPSPLEFASDRLYREAVEDWVGGHYLDDAVQAQRERDARQLAEASARMRDARVRSGQGTLADAEAYARAYGRTPDGQPLPLTGVSEQFGRAMRDLEERRAEYHGEHGYHDPDDDR